MKKYIAILFLGLIGITGCKKNNAPERTVLLTNPFKGFLDEKGLLPIELMVTSDQTVEIGYKFTVTRNQKVMKLGAMMPDAGTYTVTLWDADSESILSQANITSTPNEFVYANISAVQLEPRVNYVLSINTTSNGQAKRYYAQQLAVEPYPLFPAQLGILSISELVHRFSDQPIFPTSGISNFQYYMMGIPDLHLQ